MAEDQKQQAKDDLEREMAQPAAQGGNPPSNISPLRPESRKRLRV